MEKAWLGAIVFLVAQNVLAATGSITIQNNTVTDTILALEQDSTTCIELPGILAANGQRLNMGADQAWQINDDNTQQSCGKNTFKLNIKDANTNKTIAYINYSKLSSQTVCDNGVTTTTAVDSANYQLAHSCSNNKVSITLTHPYTPKIQFVISNLMLFGNNTYYDLTRKNYSPVQADHYSPVFAPVVKPTKVGNSESLANMNSLDQLAQTLTATNNALTVGESLPAIYLPVTNTDINNKVAISYAVDGFPGAYCSLEVLWTVDGCKANLTTNASDGKLTEYTCINIGPVNWQDSTQLPTGTCQLIFAFGSNETGGRTKQYGVEIDNQSDATLSLTSLQPANNPRHEYTPEPTQSISQNSNDKFQVSIPWKDPTKLAVDNSFTQMMYSLPNNNNYYCDFIFSWQGTNMYQDQNNAVAVCSYASVIGAASEPVRQLNCAASYTNDSNKVCEAVKLTLSTSKKERYTFITINNNSHNDYGQPLALQLVGAPIPNSTNYIVDPPTTIPLGNAAFVYGQNVDGQQDPNQGSVKYGVDGNHYCLITYDWQYNQNAVTGCQITATAVNQSAKERKIVCECDQATNSNVCRNQQLSSQQCSALIDIALAPDNEPTKYNVTIQNNYYYALNRSNYSPTASADYFVAPPASISLSQQGQFSYKLSQAQAPVVRYALANDSQNRSCEFTYSYDNTKHICQASATATGSIHCNVCSSTVNSGNESCDFIFSVGGNCVSE